MKHLLTIGELDPSQVQGILDLSVQLQEQSPQILQGKNVAFVFEKPSLRTKVGAEVAINHLGGNIVDIDGDLMFSSSKAVPFSFRESLFDAMKNVSQWCDAIFARVFSHSTLEKMKEYGDIPVVNALCDLHHPMQALADILTIQQKFEKGQKVSLTFVGDANNVAHSLTEVMLYFGHHVTFSGPEQYGWDEEKIEYFSQLSTKCGGSFTINNDPKEAVANADVLYTDTFISMGQEHMYEEKIKHFEDYQVNADLFSLTKENAGFMHCLPAHRGIEVTDDVIDHENSWVYQQAKNRMIVSKGAFTALLYPTLLTGEDTLSSLETKFQMIT
ncbi:MAG: ornithine carbamoyltransferase [Balneolaceae bacterium]|nr:ornithine carbamoyltransferase [Balneolaceae bacterium]MDR9409433.1 ornithine carbamoyltransferase [Balneolaceae bacterium]